MCTSQDTELDLAEIRGGETVKLILIVYNYTCIFPSLSSGYSLENFSCDNNSEAYKESDTLILKP